MRELHPKRYKERDTILFDNPLGWAANPGRPTMAELDDPAICAGTAKFQIRSTVLKQLIQEEHADARDRQNDSPTITQFIDFMDQWKRREFPPLRAIGYCVSPRRHDYRVTVVGLLLEGETLTKSMKAMFRRFNRKATELDVGDIHNPRRLRSWWD